MIEKNINGWLSQKKVEDLLGLKETTLWKLRSQGKLKYSRFGKKVFYDAGSIRQLLEKNTIG